MESPPPDPDASSRRDLTHLKVYAVDSEDTMEVSRAQLCMEGGGEGAEGWGAVLIIMHGGSRMTLNPQCRDRTRRIFTDQADIACTKREAP